jgi:hypothetical protein
MLVFCFPGFICCSSCGTLPCDLGVQAEVVDDTHHFFAMSMLYRRVSMWFEAHQGLDALLGPALPPITKPPRASRGDGGHLSDDDGEEGGRPSRATRRRNALADLGLGDMEIIGGGEFLIDDGEEDGDGDGAGTPGADVGPAPGGLAARAARRVAALRALGPGGAGSDGGGGGRGGGGGGGGDGSGANGGPWTLGDALTTVLGRALLPCIVLRQYLRYGGRGTARRM